MTTPALQRTPEFNRVIDIFETSGRNIFLTGRAGTGKSTLLQFFRSSTRKNVAVLAPTGVAAVNVRGQTIHSFFRFRPDITPAKVQEIRLRKSHKALYSALDAIVIDEISMVRADLFDCMDLFLRIHGRTADKPFGGIQLILIGDLYQLPPVVTRAEEKIFTDVYRSPFFFDSQVFTDLKVEYLELENIWRQREDRFIDLLNAVRDNDVSADHMQLLNSRVQPGYVPDEGEFSVYLTSTNDVADMINRERLSALRGRTHRFDGEASGDFGGRMLPTQELLELKVGAQVMLLNNDPLGRWVNGSIGQVTEILRDKELAGIRVQLSGGMSVDVEPYTWEMFKYVLNEDDGRVESEPTGAFTQFPLRLAWAVTIHRAQGKTFPKVVIDIGRGTFSHGQVYVALSRCTTLEGVILKRPILARHIMLDPRIRVLLKLLKDGSTMPALPLPALPLPALPAHPVLQ